MIYFITARELGRVKIGYSAKPDRRLSGLQIGCPVKLTMERICEGGAAEERALHSVFAGERLGGEWFNLGGTVEAHMATLPQAPRPDPNSLSSRRRALGLSQSDLADKMGISQTAVSRAEHGNKSDRRYALALEAIEMRAAAQAQGQAA